jgi:drug/metabolite transporter (DMT)-like permease
LLAVVGLYLLSVRGGWVVSPYDLIVLAGAFMWAVHVHLIAKYAARVGPVRLAMFQFAICGLLSTAVALLFEPISLSGIGDGMWAILYGSFLSVGLAYTLQVVAQRTANPTHAVIIMSLEGAFAALGGWLMLSEMLAPRDLIGAGLMLAGMFISQIFGVVYKLWGVIVTRHRKHEPTPTTTFLMLPLCKIKNHKHGWLGCMST